MSHGTDHQPRGHRSLRSAFREIQMPIENVIGALYPIARPPAFWATSKHLIQAYIAMEFDNDQCSEAQVRRCKRVPAYT
jgi:hypothetical protein